MTVRPRRVQRRCFRVLCCLALFLVPLAGGCRTAIGPHEDARIEAEIKARLVAEKAADLTRLGVLSDDSTVYLTGAVESADQQARAEALAKGVKGVRRVVNRLEVRPAPEWWGERPSEVRPLQERRNRAAFAILDETRAKSMRTTATKDDGMR